MFRERNVLFSLLVASPLLAAFCSGFQSARREIGPLGVIPATGRSPSIFHREIWAPVITI